MKRCLGQTLSFGNVFGSTVPLSEHFFKNIMQVLNFLQFSKLFLDFLKLLELFLFCLYIYKFSAMFWVSSKNGNAGTCGEVRGSAGNTVRGSAGKCGEVRGSAECL